MTAALLDVDSTTLTDAAAILAYRLAQQHAERVGEMYAQAVHMAEVLRGRMEQAWRALAS